MIAPSDLWSAYEAAADANSLLTDIVTAGTINSISDATAQVTETRIRASARDAKPDFARTGRFVTFGAVDGAASHVWFVGLDALIGEDGTLVETCLKVAADACVYTPLWCVWFLALFVLLEGRPARTIPAVLKAEWLELFRGNLGFFLPLTGLIYGCVPRDERVLAFGCASLVYTAILSLWNSARGSVAAPAGVTADGPDGPLELCEVDAEDPDCVALPRPPRAAATLSFGVRRLIVGVSRGRLSRRSRSLRMSEGDDRDSASSDWKERAKDLLTSLFVFEDSDFVRDDALSMRPAKESGGQVLKGGDDREEEKDDEIQKQADASRSEVDSDPRGSDGARTFAWGGGDDDGTESALRLPKGVAAAERLGARAKLEKIEQPPPEVRDAKADPVAVLAVLTIILFQLVGSLIGLTRDVGWLVPSEMQGAAVMDAEPPLVAGPAASHPRGALTEPSDASRG